MTASTARHSADAWLPGLAPGSSSRSASQRRSLGQVFTPRPVADWMVAWACEHHPRSILDPALGDGAFVHALSDYWQRLGGKSRPIVTAFEVDQSMIQSFLPGPDNLSVRIRREDFVASSARGSYDAVVANPPYVRHHACNYDDQLFERYDRLCGRRLSRMTNLYGLFMLRIWSVLKPGGRAALITPAEWLNADFGIPLKAHLLQANAIDAIIHFDHAASVFDDAITTAAIVLLRRGRCSAEPLRLLRVDDAAALPALPIERGIAVQPTSLDPASKWSPLFDDAPAPSTGGPRLGDIADCSRGIATGANGYFVLRESQRCRWGLDVSDLRLCISKARQITGDCITAGDVSRLVAADEPVWLLSPRQQLTKPVLCYLDEGLRLGIDKRYLPSHRPVWFRPEVRQPAPILAAVFARGGFRFVRNDADVLNLTAYHGVYPRNADPSRLSDLHAYLCSSAAQSALRRHRRIYGGGLSKVEPRDVESLEIPESFIRS